MIAIPTFRAAILGGTSPLLTDLISFWELEEASGTRNDAHGTNHLTDNNTVTQAAGKVGNAGQFTAANSEYLSATDNASLRVGSGDFTFCCWAKLDTLSAFNTLLAKYSSDYWLYLNSAAGTGARLRITSGTEAQGGGTVTTATWYFVVGWRDNAAQTLNVQLNNGTVGSIASATPPTDTASAFRIGARSPDLYFDGQIDQVAMWKRVLTTAERTWLYNAGSGRSYADVRAYRG